jgi:phytoene dehydrogenase-like protein
VSEADAIVVGGGPNGLAAAITLARAGWSVEVREAAATIGGGARTESLTLPGFHHDVCSAVHPMAVMSPFFRSLGLAARGVDWVHAPIPLAHPLDDGSATVLDRSLEATSAALGRDGLAYRRLVSPFLLRWESWARDVFVPIRVPRRPVLMARFGRTALRSARAVAMREFRGERARALLAGLAAHAVLPLDLVATASFGLVLAIAAHAVGWPAAAGGSRQIVDALANELRELGGVVRTSTPVESLDDLPSARVVLLDLTPAQVLRIASHRLPAGYRRRLAGYRYGPGAYKLDWALAGPVPWSAEPCRRAMVVHVGGSFEEITRSERDAWDGRNTERPFVIFAQPSLFDASRAPAGMHTAWAYCHVPNGSTADMTDRIEAQIERFAPGFRDLVLARSVMGPAALERHNPNLVGGDVTGGAPLLRQLLFRPVARYDPYATPLRGLYLCSAATPPGGGVHGMCGHNAALSVLRYVTVPRRS